MECRRKGDYAIDKIYTHAQAYGSGLSGIERYDRLDSKNADGTDIDEYRINAVANSVRRRIENLERLVRLRDAEPMSCHNVSTEDDVKKNVAENYSSKTLIKERSDNHER